MTMNSNLTQEETKIISDEKSQLTTNLLDKNSQSFCKIFFSKLFPCFFKKKKSIILNETNDQSQQIKHKNHHSLNNMNESREDSNHNSHSFEKNLNKESHELGKQTLIKKKSAKIENKNEKFKDYPKNILFFLQYKDFVILAKITEKNIFLEEKDKNHHNQKFYDNAINLFSLYEKGIKLDTDNWSKVCPEKLAKYIAHKVKNFSSIVDAFCGIGGNTIQVNYYFIE